MSTGSIIDTPHLSVSCVVLLHPINKINIQAAGFGGRARAKEQLRQCVVFLDLVDVLQSDCLRLDVSCLR
jgi:hypothetical protein